MNSNTDKKLESLLEKKNDIEDRIKELKKEAKTLDKKRNEILGKFIHRKLHKGEPIMFETIDDVKDFIDPLINRGTERELFGLPAIEKTKQ